MEYRDSILQNLAIMGENSYVWVILSNSAFLTNVVIDTIKQQEKRLNKLTKSLSTLPRNLMATDITDIETEDIGLDGEFATCTLEDVWRKPGKTISGRYWCLVDYASMTKKDKTNFYNYIKAPDKNVLLVVTVSDFRHVFEIKKAHGFTLSPCCHVLNIQYPSKTWLASIVKKLFSGQEVYPTEDQLYEFISKMGSAYEEYKDCVEKVSNNLKAANALNDSEIQPKDFKTAIKEIEHFEIDDLMYYLVKPITGDKPLNGKRKVHQAFAKLLEDLTPKEIALKLRYRVHDMLAYRAAINNGIIPIKIPYSAQKVQEHITESEFNAKIKKASAYTFKRNAAVANLTSIEDWFYVYIMLEKAVHSSTDKECLRILLSMINRTAITVDRLMNNIGVKNTLEEELYTLNSLLYDE